eukprot:CAMPEP_0118800110 /NCGR_PEP_ID=MMETSP1161-20130426/2113_1 /TAXON_ID=249345 /ORGANISM="Picochlorum oklahomensis, Strain CCMP2329" /LENGTH=42 /DNA_ID= /DNA_START= /DNA_END= /DNA_ORIENTATION=
MKKQGENTPGEKYLDSFIKIQSLSKPVSYRNSPTNQTITSFV